MNVAEKQKQEQHLVSAACSRDDATLASLAANLAQWRAVRDANDNTLLHLAAAENNAALFKAMLKAQADPELLGAWMIKRNDVGWTPVHVAVVCGARETLELLRNTSFSGFADALDVADMDGCYPSTLAKHQSDAAAAIVPLVSKPGVALGLPLVGYQCQFPTIKANRPPPLQFDAIPLGGLQILCLDGGGSRGIMTIGMLKRLHQDLYANIRKVHPDITAEQVHIADYFDLIAGTSTGALIAMALVSLRMPLDDIETMYLTLSAKMFGRALNWFKRLADYGAKYNTALLRMFLKDQLGADRCLTEFKGAGTHKPALCIVAAEKSTHRAHIFGNYQRQVVDPDAPRITTDCTLWQAARATSAAPFYFHHKQIEAGGESFVDGGVAANNPVLEAYGEARRIWNAKEADFGFVLSLGTGLGESDPIAVDLLNGFVQAATDSHKWHVKFQENHDRLVDQDKYVRVDGPIEFAQLDIADMDKLLTLRTAGTDEMAKHAANIAAKLNSRRVPV